MPGHPVLQQSAVWAGAQSAEQGLERSRRGSGLCDCLVAGEFLHPPQQHHHLHLCFTALVAGPLALILYGCYQMQSYYLKTQRECIWLGSITKSPIVSGFTSAIRGVGTIRAYNLEGGVSQLAASEGSHQQEDQNRQRRTGELAGYAAVLPHLLHHMPAIADSC